MTDRIWILDAPDPEMQAIETLLRECGERVEHAAVNGTRVHPGNAYRADALPIVQPTHVAYLVECDVPGIEQCRRRVIDHHRPGDPGFGAPPEEFLRASSLGQVIAELARLGMLEWRWLRAGAASGPVGTFTLFDPEWTVASSGTISHTPVDLIVPRDLVLTAAADHCLGAAYAGRCPGVDPDDLMRWRVEQRAVFQGRTVNEILRDIAAAKAALEDAVMIDLTPKRPDPLYGPDTPFVPRWSLVNDMRGRHVPELVEAGTRYGIAYVADGLPGPDGRTKVVCSGSSEVISAFLETWAPSQGLINCYGDPARGFAGGYITTTIPAAELRKAAGIADVGGGNAVEDCDALYDH